MPIKENARNQQGNRQEEIHAAFPEEIRIALHRRSPPRTVAGRNESCVLAWRFGS